MNQLQVFNNELFGQIRMVSVNNKPYAIASDIAKLLGYKRPNDAITQHCRCTVKHRIATNQGNMSDMCVIPESDIYRLIIKSKLPQAQQFENWVMEEVLPSIRQHGTYMTDNVIEKALTNPDFLIQLATTLKEEQEQRKLAEIQVQHKSNIIEGLTEELSLAELRQRLNSIMTFSGCYKQRWTLLYSEFDKKYHMNVKKRMQNSNNQRLVVPLFKNRIDYIDRELHMINDLYELACKLFETDYEKLMDTWKSTIKG